MAQGSGIQNVILQLEGGSLAVWIQRGVLLAAVLFVTVLILQGRFQNFGNDPGFDQAQIARQISKGEGFTTQVARPLQIWFMAEHGRPLGEQTKVPLPELMQAPLYPYFNSMIFNLFKSDYNVTTKSGQLIVDRALVLGSIILFLLAMGSVYVLAHKLFDGVLAITTVGLCLVCALYWDLAQRCLPQLLMLFLFSMVVLCLGMALKEEYKEDEGALRRPFPWIIPIGFLGGLLTLSHGLTVWIMVGLLVSVMLFFRGRWVYGAVILISYLAVLTPWFIRNYQVSGHPLGMAHLSFLAGIGFPTEVWMSKFNPDFQVVSLGPIRKKVIYEAVLQIRNFFPNIGLSLVAPVFFLSLLHPFRRRETGALRWAILLMFVFTFIGMCFFTHDAKGASINNLHILFLPFFTLYGMAFIVVTWNRGMPSIPILRYTAVTTLFVVNGLAMLTMLATRTHITQHWPPYLPTVMAAAGQIADEDEAVCADLPECVAYAADRVVLQMPEEFTSFLEYVDYDTLGRPIVALMLTPRTGDAPFISDIALGRYSKWAKFIMRSKDLNLQGFPLNELVFLKPEWRNVMYVDSEKLKEMRASRGLPEETDTSNLPAESDIMQVPADQSAPPAADSADPAPAPEAAPGS